MFALAELLQPERIPFPTGLAVSVVNELSFANKVKLFGNIPAAYPKESVAGPSRTASEEFYDEAAAELALAVKTAASAEERRNQLMHSQWIYGHAPGPSEPVLRAKLRTNRKGAISGLFEETQESIAEATALAEKALKLVSNAHSQFRYILRFMQKNPVPPYTT